MRTVAAQQARSPLRQWPEALLRLAEAPPRLIFESHPCATVSLRILRPLASVLPGLPPDDIQ